MEDRFPPSVAMDRRNFPRRDLPNHRARPVPYQRRNANNNPSYKAVAPRKGARIVKKKVTKQAKSKEALVGSHTLAIHTTAGHGIRHLHGQ